MNKSKPADKLCDINEAATLVNLTASHVRRMCSQGRVPGAVKLGRVWLVPRRWAENFKRQSTNIGRPRRRPPASAQATKRH